jgi:hypothetical protein
MSTIVPDDAETPLVQYKLLAYRIALQSSPFLMIGLAPPLGKPQSKNSLCGMYAETPGRFVVVA